MRFLLWIETKLFNLNCQLILKFNRLKLISLFFERMIKLLSLLANFNDLILVSDINGNVSVILFLVVLFISWKLITNILFSNDKKMVEASFDQTVEMALVFNLGLPIENLANDQMLLLLVVAVVVVYFSLVALGFHTFKPPTLSTVKKAIPFAADHQVGGGL